MQSLCWRLCLGGVINITGLQQVCQMVTESECMLSCFLCAGLSGIPRAPHQQIAIRMQVQKQDLHNAAILGQQQTQSSLYM